MNREFVYPGRTVIDPPYWPWPIGRPEECDDDSGTGIWFDAARSPQLDLRGSTRPDGVALLCPRCGLDST